MGISNKKRKFIKRHAGRKPVAEIATDLDLSPEQITAELEKTSGPGQNKSAGIQNRDNFIFRLILALAFLAPFALIDGITDYSDLPKKVFIEVSSLLLLAAWLSINIGRGGGSLEIRSCRLYLPLGVFLGWSLVSLIWTVYRFIGISQWFHWTACALIFCIALQVFRGKDRWENLLRTIAASAALISLLGIIQYLFNVEWVGQTAPPAATFANRNMAGHFIVLAFPSAVYLLFTAQRAVFARLWALAGSAMLIYSFYTFTRAAWLCLALEICLFLIYFLQERFVRKNRLSLVRFKIKALIGAVACLAIMIHLGPEGWQWREKEAYFRIAGIWDSGTVVESGTDAGLQLRTSHFSIKDRLFVWRNSLRMIRDHPWIGVGVQNYRIHFPATLNEVKSEDKLSIYLSRYQAHNDYLQVTTELGVAGLLIILWIAWEFLRMARLLLGPGSGGTYRFMAAACFIALAGMAVNSLFSFPLYSAIPPLVFALYGAMLFRIAGESNPVKSFRGMGKYKIPKTGRAIAAVTALLAFSGFATLQFRWLMADRNISLQRRSISNQLWQKAIVYGEKVRQYNPYRKDTLNYTGRAYLALEENEKAEEFLEKSGKLSPYDAGNTYHLATLHYNMGNFEKALELARKATEFSLRDGGTHYLKGQILGALGRDREALESFRLASKYSPQKNLYHYNQGYYAYKEKLYPEAASALRKSVKLEPNFELAQKYLGYALFYGLRKKEEGIPPPRKIPGSESQTKRRAKTEENNCRL